MADRTSGYGGRWKRWLAIYLVVGIAAYAAIYLLFMHHGGGSAGGRFHY
jgi:hypothetical protein